MLSDLFYTINFAVSIFASIIGLIFAFLLIIIVIINGQCHTVAHLLICNTTVAFICYTILALLSSIFGLREDWLYYQPACAFRAYCFVVICTMICHSYSIQAMSRLFFAIFYKYKHLQSYRVHWRMIIVNWLVSIFIPLVMFLINNNIFILEEESRFCLANRTVFITSIVGVLSAYMIPLSVIVVIYAIIFNRARQSTKRIVAFASRSNTNTGPANSNTMNIKRELRIMRNMMILLGCYTCAGAPYFLLILWPVFFHVLPPEPLYLLSLTLITICVETMVVITFFTSKDIKKYFFQSLKSLHQYIIN